jgi:hypothetical protein
MRIGVNPRGLRAVESTATLAGAAFGRLGETNMARQPDYLVTYEGDTFTRRTNRKYTHIVLRKVVHAREIERAIERAGELWDRYIEDWRILADAKNPRASAEEIGRAIATVSLGRDGYVAQARDRVAAQLMGASAPGRGYHWIALHWCGSERLAQRYAGGDQPNVVIVPTEGGE